MGCDGVVTGLLNADGSVDKTWPAYLVELAYPMGVTFHRAFDRTNEAFQAMEDIIKIGCERILTSGQKPTAIEGLDLITELIKKSNKRIIIMPGSGLRSDNIVSIAKQTGATEFHSSARTFINSKMSFNNPTMNEQLKNVQLDENEVMSMFKALSDI